VRQWVKPRSLLLHVVFLAIAFGCLTAGWWQLHRAEGGNTLSWLYTVEWPAFVVVAGIGWWQMFHDTPEDIAERKAFHHRMRVASAEVVARTLPRSAWAISVGSEEVAGGRALEPSAQAGELPETSGAAGPGAELAPRGAALVRPEDGTRLLSDEEDEPTDDLAAYNRYLALLAVRGKAKTWRNPHGV
jgi:hypothetical protein